MGRGHIPLTPEPRPLGPGGGSLRRVPLSWGSRPRPGPQDAQSQGPAGSGAKGWTRGAQNRASRRPAARRTSAHSPRPAVSLLFSPFSAALLAGCLALLRAASAGVPTRAGAAARLAGRTWAPPRTHPFRTVLHEQESKTRGRHPR